MPHRRWFVQRTNRDYLRYLTASCSISEPLAQVLINRGIKTPVEIRAFLSPELQNLADPFVIPGMKEASGLLSEALKAGKRILVHGDYDTDGLTATAILVKTLRDLGGEVSYFIPDRFLHGYGFNEPGVQEALKTGASLVVTVDCGITSFQTVRLAKRHGLGVIITDHHEPLRDPEGRPILPEADVVVNPLLSDHYSEGPNISGAAVALKLAIAIAGQSYAEGLIDLACLGTVADLVPLVGDSRIIVKEGIKLVNDPLRVGIKALKEVASLKRVTAGLLSFTLIPRINASGRLENAERVIRLLLTEDYQEALNLAEELSQLNTKRQGIEAEVLEEAKEILQKKGYDRCIVLASEGWHEGVVGIVASRLVEEFYRPAFVLNIEGTRAKGSARSIPDFDLYAALCECKDLLLGFGGHRQAAGLSLSIDKLPQFEERMNHLVRQSLTDEQLIPLLKIDASVRLREITPQLIRELALMEPFGYGNPEPLMGTKGLQVVNPRIVGDGHLRVYFKEDTLMMEAIGFDMAGYIETFHDITVVDAVYTPQVRQWEGQEFLQLRLEAIRGSTKER